MKGTNCSVKATDHQVCRWLHENNVGCFQKSLFHSVLSSQISPSCLSWSSISASFSCWTSNTCSVDVLQPFGNTSLCVVTCVSADVVSSSVKLSIFSLPCCQVQSWAKNHRRVKVQRRGSIGRPGLPFQTVYLNPELLHICPTRGRDWQRLIVLFCRSVGLKDTFQKSSHHSQKLGISDWVWKYVNL